MGSHYGDDDPEFIGWGDSAVSKGLAIQAWGRTWVWSHRTQVKNTGEVVRAWDSGTVMVETFMIPQTHIQLDLMLVSLGDWVGMTAHSFNPRIWQMGQRQSSVNFGTAWYTEWVPGQSRATYREQVSKKKKTLWLSHTYTAQTLTFVNISLWALIYFSSIFYLMIITKCMWAYIYYDLKWHESCIIDI